MVVGFVGGRALRRAQSGKRRGATARCWRCSRRPVEGLWHCRRARTRTLELELGIDCLLLLVVVVVVVVFYGAIDGVLFI